MDCSNDFDRVIVDSERESVSIGPASVCAIHRLANPARAKAPNAIISADRPTAASAGLAEASMESREYTAASPAWNSNCAA